MVVGGLGRKCCMLLPERIVNCLQQMYFIPTSVDKRGTWVGATGVCCVWVPGRWLLTIENEPFPRLPKVDSNIVFGILVLVERMGGVPGEQGLGWFCGSQVNRAWMEGQGKHRVLGAVVGQQLYFIPISVMAWNMVIGQRGGSVRACVAGNCVVVVLWNMPKRVIGPELVVVKCRPVCARGSGGVWVKRGLWLHHGICEAGGTSKP